MSKSGWPELVAMAEGRNADCTIGGDDDKNIPVLNGTNWQLWKFKMRAYLQSKECWLIVDGTKPRSHKWEQEEYSIPAVTEVEKGVEKVVKEATMAWRDTTKVTEEWLEWTEADNKALGIITLKLSPSLSMMIKKTAALTWAGLIKCFDQPGAAGVYVDFQKAIRWKFPQNKNPVQEIGDLMVIIDRLAANKIVFPENLQVMMILEALPDGWDHLASTLLHSVESEDLTLQDVVPKLQDEWDRRSIRHGGGDSHAFVARNTIKHPGRKPQWQTQQQPQYRQPQQQNSGQHQNRPQGPRPFQSRPLCDRIAPYNPNQQCFQARQQEGFNPNIAPGARGPNYNKNAQNR